MTSAPEQFWEDCAHLSRYLAKVPQERQRIAVRAISDLLIQHGAHEVLEEGELVTLESVQTRHDFDGWLATKALPEVQDTWTSGSGLLEELTSIMAEYEEMDD